MRCPCRKKSETIAYDACCGRWHAGAAAPTPEALMRSRYAAFATGKAAYLLATWHGSTRPARLDLTAEEHWLSLRVIAASTASDGLTGTVEFVARSRIGGASRSLHEVSRFVHEGGRWYYLDGTALQS